MTMLLSAGSRGHVLCILLVKTSSKRTELSMTRVYFVCTWLKMVLLEVSRDRAVSELLQTLIKLRCIPKHCTGL